MTSFTENELLSLVLSKRKLKSALKGLTSKDLDSVVSILESESEKLKVKEQEQEQKLAQRRETLDQIRELLQENSLTPEDLLMLDGGDKQKSPKKPKEAKPPLPPKYHYTGENGEVVTWSGAGRMPKVIKNAVDSGVDLNSMLI